MDERGGVLSEHRDVRDSFNSHQGGREVLGELRCIGERPGSGVDVNHRHGKEPPVQTRELCRLIVMTAAARSAAGRWAWGNVPAVAQTSIMGMAVLLRAAQGDEPRGSGGCGCRNPVT